MRAVLAERVASLRQAPLFRSFSDFELFELAQQGVLRRLRRDELLVFEGEEPSALFVLIDGEVRIFREGCDGREQILRIERATSVLNAVQLFDNGPHPASISSCHDACILSLPLIDCRHRIQASGAATMDAIRLFAGQLRGAFDLVDSLSLLTVDQRVAQFLLDEARRGRRRLCDELTIDLTMSNQQIGAVVGAVREVVSRSLSKLHKNGLITFSGRTATIPDEVQLVRFIDSNRVNRTVRAAAS